MEFSILGGYQDSNENLMRTTRFASKVTIKFKGSASTRWSPSLSKEYIFHEAFLFCKHVCSFKFIVIYSTLNTKKLLPPALVEMFHRLQS